MSWTDLQSIEHIKQLRDKFKIKTFIETGTHVGVNAALHSKNFKKVLTCEKVTEYYLKARERCNKIPNVSIYQQNSTEFLEIFRYIKMPIFYLDAHFFDPKLKQPFVVLDELKTLKDKKDCIIIIHDFDNGLGHITYHNQPLNFELLKNDLLAVNPDFKFYTNELSSCNIKKLEDAKDWEEFKNLRYTWSKPEKTYRGILYCVPKEVKIDGLKLIR